MKKDVESREECKFRYPPSGRYTSNEQPGASCTFEKECAYDCKVACGSESCSESWGDFLSVE